MFGPFPVAPNLTPRVAPEDIPSPTPITLPRYQPFTQDDVIIGGSGQSLPALLGQTGRDSLVLGPAGLLAIGLDLRLDADESDLIPDTAYLPDFRQWDRFTSEEACRQDGKDRFPLKNGNLSPGCQVYLERRRELSNTNDDAFRTVRRIPPPKGKQQARLGNTYEFFRCLELFTSFWDDPSRPPELPPSPELSTPTDTPRRIECEAKTHAGPSQTPTIRRTASGQSMPPEYRQHVLNAFIKLVAYDFGCNVSRARLEPRLHLNSPPGRKQRKSYTPSNCHFVFQSPMTRETARAGVVYGPVAAVTARPTVNFTGPDAETAQSSDLAREVLAALITAQHRDREGKEEVRFGQDQWWTTQRRWGGGLGGPIGREIQRDASSAGDDGQPAQDVNGGRSRPAVKRARKTMPIYDNYRMVRPPPPSWDRKAKYEAIGKVEGADYDDIFVMSSLFHHVSVLRVRVPTRLLEVLDGSPEPDPSRRSWGKVRAWKSAWYDFFDVDDRITAMRLVWAVVAYQMREKPGGGARVHG
ncbi:uncharacterized protein MAM_00078 [Metarhizium album ARSEF 1941]|uniref:Uncharacterized protein n=1 Tax=Metarhizium album (strain ARSEF 1941) TaxID=1081103 RepID=A0A0B2WXR4_METAS|nr:uncharacterized protein MAM_00078 [Metarhizium album ARSEF 1941]KHO01077.1 hypothetical protein MAM_00078 [Metarhizium album ARSEF 1941]